MELDEEKENNFIESVYEFLFYMYDNFNSNYIKISLDNKFPTT